MPRFTRALCLAFALAACDGGEAAEPDARSDHAGSHAASSPDAGARDAASISAADAATHMTADGAVIRVIPNDAGGDAMEREEGGARDAAQDDAAQAARGDAESDAAPLDPDAGQTGCPAHGEVTYTLQQSSAPSPSEAMAYAKIREAMDKAVEKYNCYTDLSRAVHVSYDPGVATADGNPNGSIRFGSTDSMHFVTAMHELSHVFGVGAPEFKPLVQDGVFSGMQATAKLRELTGDPSAVVKSDGTHFWPYGLNYVSEYMSERDLSGHCAMVLAIRADIGL